MFRIAATVLVALTTALVILSISASAQVADTGYSITNPKFGEYFQRRGGARVLGHPISREFDLLGSRVQFFQRAILQLRPNGSVGMMNVLDEGLLPYTRINGSTFPAPDLAVVQAAPPVSDPSYGSRVVDFVKAMAPDEWEGLRVNFFRTFSSTVSYQEAFPNADADPGLLPLINLEMWGLPISKPTYDPNNGNFVYLRFQRGIMHFDKTTGLTQGILIGDYLKSVITGQNLPLDLDQQARNSRFYRQYNNGLVGGIARPGDLPGSNLFAAFEKDGVNVPMPQPTAVAPTATPAPVPSGPAAQSTPVAIAVSGSSTFVEIVNMALDKLATKAPGYYQIVRANVFRIEEASVSGVDASNRTLRIRESEARIPDWRFNPDNQAEWLAGLLVHHATHIEQAVNGRPTMGLEAEREARLRQKDVLSQIETDTPGMQFANLITDLLNGKEASWGEWDPPRDPQPTATPTTTD